MAHMESPGHNNIDIKFISDVAIITGGIRANAMAA